MRGPDDWAYGRAVRFSSTLRGALLGGALSVGLVLPGAALGHGQSLSASTMSLESAAKVCREDTPRAEKRLRALEVLALGSHHAAEHASERAEGRREACAPKGGLKPSFVKRVKAQASVKRVSAVGPASQVGQWSGPIDLPGIVAIHTTLMANGKVLFFYNNPNFGDEARGRVMVWDPATQTGVRRDVPGQHLVRGPGRARRRPRAGGRRQPEVRGRRAHRLVQGPEPDLDLRPGDRDLAARARHAPRSLVPDGDEAARRPGADHRRLGRVGRRSGGEQPRPRGLHARRRRPRTGHRAGRREPRHRLLPAPVRPARRPRHPRRPARRQHDLHQPGRLELHGHPGPEHQPRLRLRVGGPAAGAAVRLHEGAPDRRRQRRRQPVERPPPSSSTPPTPPPAGASGRRCRSRGATSTR